MSKIICDICGTTYQDTADSCPICGCSRDSALDLLGDEFQLEDAIEEPKAKKGRYSSKKRKEIFDYDEVNPQPEDKTQSLSDEPEDDEDDGYDDRPRSNTFAVIALTVLIAGLLLATAFLVVRYILPNLDLGKPAPTTAAVQNMDPVTESTGYIIPCQNITIVGGAAHLNEEGQYFLLNLTTVPEDTTDTFSFASADESIATVDENGRITAVSEGETVIYITCGNSQVECPVICDFTPETEPTTEPETEPATEATEETAEQIQETKAPVRTDVVLKLKKSDISMGVHLKYRMVLDCDLDPEDVEWSSDHPHIVSVDETGLITAVKKGTTDIVAKYGDQEVRCIVRVG